MIQRKKKFIEEKKKVKRGVPMSISAAANVSETNR